jgi:hypothetical protein
LTGWTCARRAVVFRRSRQRAESAGKIPLLEQSGLQVASQPLYEYVVLVTNLKENLTTLLHLYRQRADVENAYDELKNQWGWRIYHPGFIALSDGRLDCGVGLQLVESIRALRRSPTSSRSDY